MTKLGIFLYEQHSQRCNSMIKTDWIIGIYTYLRGTKNIDMNIPQGNSREEVKMRDQIIKDFYAGWIAEHPEKKMWNEALQDYILVK